MSKKLEIQVEKISAYCPYEYVEGQKIPVNGYDTPDGFCGGAYTALFPIIVALNSGARFEFEEDPLSKTKMACPDDGKVTFKVKLLE